MATDLWDLPAISSPAAGDRIGAATGPGAGGRSLRGDFVWKNAASNFLCAGPLCVGGTAPAKSFVVTNAGTNGFEVEPGEFDGTRLLSYNRTAGWYTPMYLEGDSIRVLTSDGSARWVFNASGHLLPLAANSYDIADGSARVRNLYLQNSPNVSSDAGLKDVRGADGAPSDAEIAWAHALRPLCYQMKDAIASKGTDAARLHWGVIAQEVYQAGIDAGIADPFAYGFVGRDPKMQAVMLPTPVKRQKTRVEPATESVVEMRDGHAVLVDRPVDRIVRLHVEHVVRTEDGEIVMVEGPDGLMPMIHREPDIETVEIEQEVETACIDENGDPEYIWNIRYDELLMFAWACGALGGAA